MRIFTSYMLNILFDNPFFSALSIPKQCSVSGEENIILNNDETYIASNEIKSSCLQPNKKWKLKAQTGQRLNISLIHLKEGNEGRIYGSIESSNDDDHVVFGPGTRKQYLISSSDYAVITLQQHVFEDAHFIIHITGNFMF